MVQQHPIYVYRILHKLDKIVQHRPNNLLHKYSINDFVAKQCLLTIEIQQLYLSRWQQSV